MQLCTNARIFLDMVAASGQPKLWELTPPEARQKVIELTRMVECEEAIGKIEDRTLPGPAGPLPFGVYTPLAELLRSQHPARSTAEHNRV